MRRNKILIALALAALCVPRAAAQTDVDVDSDLGTRLAISAEKKLAKGLHLAVEEEIRFDNNFSSLGRLHTTVGLDYRVAPWLKVGVGYAWILPYDSDGGAFKSSRHRLMADATLAWRVGDWRLSLRERVQATVRTGSYNEYQVPGTLWGLKSRVKVQYKGWRRVEPYASFEVRNTLNAPSINANYNGTYYLTDAGSRTGEAGWFLDGFNKAYVDRLRGVLGVQYTVSKASTVDVALMLDRTSELVVDANAEGTKLKSYTREKGFVGWLTVGYCYSF